MKSGDNVPPSSEGVPCALKKQLTDQESRARPGSEPGRALLRAQRLTAQGYQLAVVLWNSSVVK